MVFYRGRAPSGRKTEWKMNEYKAIEGEASASTSATPPFYFLYFVVFVSQSCRNPSKGRRLSEVSEFECILIVDMGCGKSQLAQQIGDSCKCYGFLKLIDHGMSLEEVDEKMSKLEVKFLSLPVEEELKRYSAQTLSPTDFSRCAVQNQSILGASGSPFCEFEAYTLDPIISITVSLKFVLAAHVHRVDSLMVVDFNGGFSNKGFKSAPIGFYPKDEHTVFQKTKHIKYSKGGRAENNAQVIYADHEDDATGTMRKDGEDNWRPSDSNFLSLILRIVLLLMVLLIVLSLIVWLMS
ncbi:hypothetical protein Patl1_15001 [Pistacia atlantica]|uniref:Uncharacterized protein n=1 Tax=Pistacia atlantica TaxID=434234 RepID=A0ACC1B7I1_9ROSI|nr:hypothetical protein Patl1_15001 [Pistacia atlantica]